MAGPRTSSADGRCRRLSQVSLKTGAMRSGKAQAEWSLAELGAAGGRWDRSQDNRVSTFCSYCRWDGFRRTKGREGQKAAQVSMAGRDKKNKSG